MPPPSGMTVTVLSGAVAVSVTVTFPPHSGTMPPPSGTTVTVFSGSVAVSVTVMFPPDSVTVTGAGAFWVTVTVLTAGAGTAEYPGAVAPP
ncbi:hypothetical protein BJX96DRAFT_142854 [Aspergillus floccosus]